MTIRDVSMDRFRETVTTTLDVLATLAVAGGVSAGLFPTLGWWSLAPGGLIVFGALRLQDWYAELPARDVRAKARRIRRATRAQRVLSAQQERRKRAAANIGVRTVLTYSGRERDAA